MRTQKKTKAEANAIRQKAREESNASRQLRFKDLWTEKGISYSRMTVWRMMRDGQFPQSLSTPTGRVFWWEHEIDEHLAKLERGGGSPIPEKKTASLTAVHGAKASLVTKASK